MHIKLCLSLTSRETTDKFFFSEYISLNTSKHTSLTPIRLKYNLNIHSVIPGKNAKKIIH